MTNPPFDARLQQGLSPKEKHRQQYSELIQTVEKLDSNIVPHYLNLIDYIGYYFNNSAARAPRDLYITILASAIKVTEFLSNNSSKLELSFQSLTKHILRSVQSELNQDLGTIANIQKAISSALSKGENPAYNVPEKEPEG
jgi:hypothetical protein